MALKYRKVHDLLDGKNTIFSSSPFLTQYTGIIHVAFKQEYINKTERNDVGLIVASHQLSNINFVYSIWFIHLKQRMSSAIDIFSKLHYFVWVTVRNLFVNIF